jgi:hypothetical protein
LRDDIEDVADENGGEQKNGDSPSGKRKFYGPMQRNTRVEHGQKNIDAGWSGRVHWGERDGNTEFTEIRTQRAQS